ncbi:MAG: YetF domain-containing protein [Ferruginibacter sp.]
MVGTDSTLQGGVAAALGLFICNYIFKYFINRSKKFSNILQGEKIVLIQDGQALQLGLKHATMSIDELKEQ